MSILAGICYAWAAIGIGSRIAMAVMGSTWKEWETENAYKAERPAWVVVVGLVGIALIGLTWYVALTGEQDYGWIVAALLSLTGVKIAALLFNYEQFRSFVVNALSNSRTMAMLNVGVVIFSAGLIALGALLYS